MEFHDNGIVSNPNRFAVYGSVSFPLRIDADVLVLAGDIHPSPVVRDSVKKSLEDYYQIPVVMPLGNHDYWGSTYANPGTEVIEVNGFKIASNTLWTNLRDDPWAAPKLLQFSDKHRIKGMTSMVWQEAHETALEDFRRIKPDIVVSHHAPSYLSVSDEFVGDPFNTFFVSNLNSFIEELDPILWIHGHVHSYWDYRIGNTRVLCNPLGYPGEIKRPVDVRTIPVFKR